MLNKKSPTPLYRQLKTTVEELIDSGQWPIDTQVPSERELCDQYEISRITVRQALSQLVAEGRLVRSHGRGTFVANSPLKKRLLPLIGFSEEIRSRGQKPGSRVLHFDRISSPAPAARALNIAEKQEIFVVKRLRLADYVPMAVETVHLPANLCADLQRKDLENRSLYETLEKKNGIVPIHAYQQWQAVACPADDADLLAVPDRSPVFRIQRTTFYRENVPFEYVDSYFRGDKYIFHAELHNER